MVSAKEIAFFGGMQAEAGKNTIGVLNLLTNQWSSLAIKSSLENILRDDFAVADMKDGSFFTLGGYVNGSRVDDICKFKHEGGHVSCDYIAGEDNGNCGPSKRASMSVGVHG